MEDVVNHKDKLKLVDMHKKHRRAELPNHCLFCFREQNDDIAAERERKIISEQDFQIYGGHEYGE